MQNCTTILGIIDMRQRGISYDDCRNRYRIGCSTISLIMSRFNSCGKDLDTLRQMPADEVEQLFFPPENLRRKDDAVMPDYQMVYDRLTADGSRQQGKLILSLAEIQKRVSVWLSVHTVLLVFQAVCRKELWFRSCQYGSGKDSR